MRQAILWAALGTGFTFLFTSMGAGMVFFLKNKVSVTLQQVFLGFAAGVMVAASVWSLLIPAIEMAEENGQVGWVAAAGGFIMGIAFLMLLDHVLPHLHAGAEKAEGPPSKMKRTSLLILAVTLHNIPEGMAVGLTCALAAQNNVGVGAALALALGVGIQNFPEGAAISLPLRQEGMPRWKAFLWGAASGIVEPIFGVLAVLLVGVIGPYMPWLLSFAAGAMMYVVVEELIPEAHLGEHSHPGTIGVMAGFVLMMILDVALG